jgi:hypothetical protein
MLFPIGALIQRDRSLPVLGFTFVRSQTSESSPTLRLLKPVSLDVPRNEMPTAAAKPGVGQRINLGDREFNNPIL